MSQEDPQAFESRKRDHMALALEGRNEARGGAGFQAVELIHEALPEIDFAQISLKTKSLGLERSVPLYVSSMTAGHKDSSSFNTILARACAERGWWMGVGSQRRELSDLQSSKEWQEVRAAAPKAMLLGNLGVAQLIRASIEDIHRLVDSLEAVAMIIHANPLQECVQPEGTPQFKGGLKALENLCKVLPVPVVLKETGCGISKNTMKRLAETGLAAVDVSGFGGTHWGRIEGQRAQGKQSAEVAETFANWGIGTVESLLAAQEFQADFEVWASGGVRTGLDAAKSLALGAVQVGFAKPILEAALDGPEKLLHKMSTIEYELKTALFCTGCQSVDEIQSKDVWRWQNK